jgi:hypothetical protein
MKTNEVKYFRLEDGEGIIIRQKERNGGRESNSPLRIPGSTWRH